MIAAAVHVAAILVLLAAVAFLLVYGLRALGHDIWTRLAWAAVRLSRAAPRAGEFLACLGDYVAAWLAVRAIKDAPVTLIRRPPSCPPPFGDAPHPDDTSPSMLPLIPSPNPADVTSVDLPPARPYLDECPPFGVTVAAVLMTSARETGGWPR